MGRKSKQQQAKKKAKLLKVKKALTDVPTGKDDAPKHSVEKLLDQAESCIDQFNYELAHKFCQRALQSEPENIRALEVSGAVLLELDDMEGAKECFKQAISLQPDEGHSKFMYMGQLETDKTAADYFSKGIDLMKKCLALAQQAEETGDENQACAKSSPKDAVTVRDISSAHCSVAEIYMTDACFEEDAESRCKENLDEALTIDASNPEVYHLLASYHLSTDDPKLAEENIHKGLDLWLPKLREVAKPASTDEVDAVEVCEVSYPARVNAVKILIELQNYEVATEILELLLDEDDSILEVWYLLGWANYLQGEDYKNNARYYLQRAHKVAVQSQSDDKDLSSHIEELLEELGPGETEEDDEVAAEDGEMEIDSSSDEDDHPKSTEEPANMEH